MAFIEVVVDSIRVNKETNQYAVILKEKSSDRYMPIWTAEAQADAIAIKMQNISAPRPMTHDLICNLINVMGFKLLCAQISHLKNDTFYAYIIIQSKKEQYAVDCIPSDAIAAALRAVAPIYVEASILEEAGIILDKETGKPISIRKEEHKPKVSKEELRKLHDFYKFIERLNAEEKGPKTK
ncbi:MAG TPA: bifunctional nuclease family protein [Dehalococcoidia bacterium]|jgi:bifunctional DNase/RNase